MPAGTLMMHTMTTPLIRAAVRKAARARSGLSG
jgi:hypothetical protein